MKRQRVPAVVPAAIAGLEHNSSIAATVFREVSIIPPAPW